jgi:hypothetical protein
MRPRSYKFFSIKAGVSCVRLGLERTHLRLLLIRLYDWERALPAAASVSGACVLPRSAQDSACAHPRSILMPDINLKQCFLLYPATTREQQAANVNRASIQMRHCDEWKQHAPLFNFTVVRNEINFHSQLVLSRRDLKICSDN